MYNNYKSFNFKQFSEKIMYNKIKINYSDVHKF